MIGTLKTITPSHAQSSTPSPTLQNRNIVQRKCACGGSADLNGDCAECRIKKLIGENPPTVQSNLKISQPFDKYEKEAERVADEVMGMRGPQIQRSTNSENDEEEKTIQTKPLVSQISPLVQRQIFEEIQEEDERLTPPSKGLAHPLLVKSNDPQQESSIQPRKANNIVNQDTGSSQIQKAMQSMGQPLESSIRGFMEQRFGYDFSSVRIYKNSTAKDSARALNAHAFTKGHKIVFDPEIYKPNSFAGKHLLAHELTHIVQQNPVTAAWKSSGISPFSYKNGNRFSKRAMHIKENQSGQLIPNTPFHVNQRTLWRPQNSNIIQRKSTNDTPPSVEQLEAQNPGIPECGWECVPQFYPVRGDHLRKLTGLAVRLVGDAINRLDRIASSSPDPLFNAVFRTTNREIDPGPQLYPLVGPKRRKNLIRKVQKGFEVIQEELNSIKVGWKSDSPLLPSTPFPGGPMGQPFDSCKSKPTYQKFVCYDHDPFDCLYDDHGNERRYRAYTDKNKGSDVNICKKFWNLDDLTGARALIHEMAHHVPGMTEEVYMHEPKFINLTSSIALSNPDSYAEFALLVHQGLGPQAAKSMQSDATSSFSLGVVGLSAPKSMEINTIGQQNIKACSHTKIRQINNSLISAQDIISRVLQKIEPQHIACWFGSKDRYPRVIGMVHNVGTMLSKRTISWTCQEDHNNRCTRSDAFVGHDERGRVINLCPRFFNRRDPDYAIIHELFHIAGANLGKKGERYDLKSLSEYACFFPLKALDNPENYIHMLKDAEKKGGRCSRFPCT